MSPFRLIFTLMAPECAFAANHGAVVFTAGNNASNTMSQYNKVNKVTVARVTP